MSYIAPVKDMLFNIEHLARIDQIAQIPQTLVVRLVEFQKYLAFGNVPGIEVRSGWRPGDGGR